MNLEDQQQLVDALEGKAPTGKLRLFEYTVLQHPVFSKETNKHEGTTIFVDSGRLLAPTEQVATLTIFRGLSEDIKEKSDRVEVAVRPF